MIIILSMILVSSSLLLVACIWLFMTLPEAYTSSMLAWPLVAIAVLTFLASICGLAAKSSRDRCYWHAVLLAVLTPLLTVLSVPAWASTGDSGLVGVLMVAPACALVTLSGVAGCVYSAATKRRKPIGGPNGP